MSIIAYPLSLCIAVSGGPVFPGRDVAGAAGTTQPRPGQAAAPRRSQGRRCRRSRRSVARRSVRSWCDGSSDRSFMVIPLSYCRRRCRRSRRSVARRSVRSWCDGSSDRSFMVIPLSYCRDADVVVLAGQ